MFREKLRIGTVFLKKVLRNCPISCDPARGSAAGGSAGNSLFLHLCSILKYAAPQGMIRRMSFLCRRKAVLLRSGALKSLEGISPRLFFLQLRRRSPSVITPARLLSPAFVDAYSLSSSISISFSFFHRVVRLICKVFITSVLLPP